MILCFTGVPLSNGRASEECQALPQATSAEYPNHHDAFMASRRWSVLFVWYYIALDLISRYPLNMWKLMLHVYIVASVQTVNYLSLAHSVYISSLFVCVSIICCVFLYILQCCCFFLWEDFTMVLLSTLKLSLDFFYFLMALFRFTMANGYIT